MSTKKEKCCEKCYFEVKYIEQIGTEPTTEGKMIDCRNEFCPCHQSESIEWETEFLKNNCGCEAAFKDRGMVDPGCFGHRVIESGIIEQAITTAVAKEKQSIWKEVFEKGYEFSGQDLKEAVKARDKELVEEVEKEYTTHEDTKAHGRCNVQCHKITENLAKDFFLSILKH